MTDRDASLRYAKQGAAMVRLKGKKTLP